MSIRSTQIPVHRRCARPCFIGRTEIAELLVDAHADVNLPNRDLATPLHIAVFMGRSKEAALLLKAGADVNARDGSGLTPKELPQDGLRDDELHCELAWRSS